MKKIVLFCSLLLTIAFSANAQISKSGNITANETWTNNNIYLLNGFVYVKSGVTLTIQAGTIIKGSFANKGSLIIERGGKLIADGTASMPIVFTSEKNVGQRNYGDWGGIILCGNASVNLPANAANGTAAGEGLIEGGVGSIYGGGASPNDDDSSGVLRYVRIEFPGIAFQPNSEINGLTMGAVGRKTVIENIQVSYSGDDSYEWFGGTVNCKYLVAYRGFDDDFDADNGYRGKVQFAVSLRDPAVADVSGSNGFESDNDGTGTGNTPLTQPIFSNVSIFGPYSFGTTINAQYRRGAHLRRNTRACIYNSVIAGYPVGLLIESATTHTNATNNDLQFRNNVLVNMADTLAANTNANPNNVDGSFDITSWFTTTGFNNQQIGLESSLLINSLSLTVPDLLIGATSPLASGSDFTNSNLTDPFFTPTTYVGAFGTSGNWMATWTEFDPQNELYNSAVGIQEQTAVSSSTLYPNPANDQMNIAINADERADFQILAYDLTGKVVLSENREFSSGLTVLNYDVKGWSNGIYFVRISSASASKVMKVVISR